jgi:hypothetical protein
LLGDPFQTRRDIDAVAHQIAVALLDDVSEMDANPEHEREDGPSRWQRRPASAPPINQFDRNAFTRVYLLLTVSFDQC